MFVFLETGLIALHFQLHLIVYRRLPAAAICKQLKGGSSVDHISIVEGMAKIELYCFWTEYDFILTLIRATLSMSRPFSVVGHLKSVDVGLHHMNWCAPPEDELMWCYRSAPQVANLGGHPVQPPFKIPESIIYYFLVASDMRISLNIYVHLNVTKFDRHIFEKTLFLVTWLNSLYYCSDVSITDSIITTFFEAPSLPPSLPPSLSFPTFFLEYFHLFPGTNVPTCAVTTITEEK